MINNTGTWVVIPNWNGGEFIGDALDALLRQESKHRVLVVDNGSTDESVEIIRRYDSVKLIQLTKNTGFANGVNAGIKYALKNGANFIALINNDATPEKNWIKNLLIPMEDSDVGIVTGVIYRDKGPEIDSTGEHYSSWGLPFPRGRDEQNKKQYNKREEVFGASGGASLYRAEMFKHIGLFDDKFFAYLEDVDISFRAQLAGWKVAYEPKAIAYHQIGGTSSKIKGFTTYHYMKNLPMLFWKNMPLRYIPLSFPKLFFAYCVIIFKALLLGPNRWAAIKGHTVWLKNIPHTFSERKKIQKNKKVSDEYIWSILTHDLPPNAANLRRLRSFLKIEWLRK
jgi:GT2 family glycosyltransferase